MNKIMLIFSFIFIAFAPFSAKATAPTEENLVLAGGCFWGMEAVFEHMKGVTHVVSGYTGGAASTANYDQVSTGETGHAESVKVTYDPAIVSAKQILQVYFTVAHDPTELNYQGPDHGAQYRSAIFYATPEQKKLGTDMIAEMQKEKGASTPIVTTLEPLTQFYPAEEHHQNFAALHPFHPYIMAYDAQKVRDLKKDFPALYIEKQG